MILGEGWVATAEGRYVTLKHANNPGVIQIKLDDEGYVVDIWDQAMTEVVATTAVEFNELEAGE